MLSKSIRTAIPFALALKEKGIQLSVPLNSDLGPLVQTSCPDRSTDQACDMTAFLSGVENATMITGQLSDYEGYRESLVSELIGPVKNHLKIAREVGVLATTLADAVKKYASHAEDDGASTSFEIISDRLHEVFENDFVKESIERRPMSQPSFPNGSILTAPRTRDEILGLLTNTGNTKLDQSLQLLVDSFDYSWLENIYYAFISRNVVQDHGLDARYMNAKPPGERAAIYLVTGLLASSVFQNPPKDASGNLEASRTLSSTVRDFCFSRAASSVDDYRLQVQNQNLIWSYSRKTPDEPTQKVWVNGEVYDEWLEKGGRPELILAVVLSGRRLSIVDEISEEIDSLMQTWNGYCAVHASRAAVRRSDFLRSVYATAFMESMSKIELFEEQYRKENIHHAETATAQATEWLKTQPIAVLDNYDMVALKLIGQFRFPYLPAYEILREINVILHTDPDVPVREAALVASISYIARYLFTQMSILRTK